MLQLPPLDSIPSSLFLAYALCLSPVFLLLYFELSSARSAARLPKGCRKLGLFKQFSNLRDEFDYGTDGKRRTRSRKGRSDNRDHDGSSGGDYGEEEEEEEKKIRIKALLAYPIKSCAGVEFNVAEVIETGMKYDRLFTFAEFVENTTASTTCTDCTAITKEGNVEKPSGRWVTRTMRDAKFSKLALVQPEIWVPDPSSPSYHPKRPEVISNGVLVVHYPRPLPSTNNPIHRFCSRLFRILRLTPLTESFQVPLEPPPGHSYPTAPLRIWRDSPTSIDYGTHVPTSLRTFLQIPPTKRFTLFRSDAAHTRAIFRCAPRKEELGFQPNTGFADAYPLHLLSISSVRDVAERVRPTIPRLTARRFRPNIILEGSDKYAEDNWKQILFIPGCNARSVREMQPRHQQQRLQQQQKEDEEEKEKEFENENENKSKKEGGERGERKKSDEHDVVEDDKVQVQKIIRHKERGVKVYTSCRTVRCRLPNVDPDTGERNTVEPDKTLKSFRCIDGGDPKNACLGMQLVPAQKGMYLTYSPLSTPLFFLLLLVLLLLLLPPFHYDTRTLVHVQDFKLIQNMI